MDINTVRIAITLVTLGAFVGIVWWAYMPSRKNIHERNAMLPFEGDER